MKNESENNQLIIEKLSYYSQLKLSWNIKDILWILDHNIAIKDLLDYENMDALCIFLDGAYKEKVVGRGTIIIKNYLEKFNEVDSLRTFIINDLEKKHCFIRYNDDESNDDDNDNYADHDDLIENEKAGVKDIINVYMDAGYKIEEILTMDMKDFEYISNYVIEKHEQKLNDALYIIHNLGILVGVAVNNGKEYPDKPNKIRLKPLTKQEKIMQIQAETKKFFDSMMADIEK